MSSDTENVKYELWAEGCARVIGSYDVLEHARTVALDYMAAYGCPVHIRRSEKILEGYIPTDTGRAQLRSV